MKNMLGSVARCFGVSATVLAVFSITAGTLAIPNESQAQTNVNYATQPLIVQNDRGGLLRKRLIEIKHLRRENRPVEIRGAVCYSTCTMFLSLPNTCVSPKTTFGFHGPTSYGRALEQDVFNMASEVIASHYPSGLKKWYMEKARFKTFGVYRVSGQQIIKQGIKAC